jgi:hypothetical protein
MAGKTGETGMADHNRKNLSSKHKLKRIDHKLTR